LLLLLGVGLLYKLTVLGDYLLYIRGGVFEESKVSFILKTVCLGELELSSVVFQKLPWLILTLTMF